MKSQAKILEHGIDERGGYVIVDKSNFYPQGGGQPADKGTIDDIPVTHVATVEGKTRHYGTFESLSGDVTLVVDDDARLLHSKLHSAGHLVGSVVEEIYPALKPTKAYHYPAGPYVEFEGEIADEAESALKKINERIAVAVKTAGKLSSSKSENGMTIVAMEGFPPTMCGGTHVETLSWIDKTRATKMKRKEGKWRVSYGI